MFGGLATPLQYFDRMSLSNEVFGDDVRLEGVAKSGGKIRTVVSQPLIVGRISTPDEIVVFMKVFLFEEFEANEKIAWYRRADNVVAFDAHTKNFITNEDGPIPIDLIVFHPDEETRLAIEQLLKPIPTVSGPMKPN